MKEKKRIWLASPHMSENHMEQKFIQEAFDTNWVAPLGKNVNEFEHEICARTGAGAAAALTAGTAALHLAYKSLEIGRGDLVFCQDLTFSATVNPILYEGGIPVFIDSETDTWNMDPKALRKAFEKYQAEGLKPKAVVVVHLYGMAAKLDEIQKICREYDVPLVEDAAESLGTNYKGKPTGTFGAYAAFSFNGNKIITTSGGGMLLCNTEDAEARAAKARFWSTQARDKARHYQHSELGYNYRMSNIVAGIGRGQLTVLDQRIAKKQYIFSYYKKALGDLEGLSFMPEQDWSENNCWLSVIQLDPNGPVRPLDIMLALEEDNVESRPVWKPMHLQPIFADCDFVTSVEEELRITDEETGADSSIGGQIFANGVCLPSDTKMDDEDLERVCGLIRKLWER